MFLGFIYKKAKLLFSGNDFGETKKEHKDTTFTPDGNINTSLKENLDKLKEMFGNSPDLKIYEFKFGPEGMYSGALAFIDGLVKNSDITESILRPIREWFPEDEPVAQTQDITAILTEKILCAGEVRDAKSLSEMAGGCLSGETAVIVDGCANCIIVSTKGWEKRSVTEPQSETVVRGPREGFTENLRTNTALLRRKIKSPQLRAEMIQIGRKTRTDVCIMYINEVAEPKVIEEVRYRLNNISVDSILESGYIEQYIEDAPFSPYATVGNSEKPDVVAGKLLEGRVAIVVDGTPFVITVPMLFIESFQTSEDYYSRPLYASTIRILRMIAYLLTVFAPAIFIALTSFHPELIPSQLLVTIANAREGTPFPVFVETLIMVFAYEVLREAGIRLPRPVGQAMSIVGALIMGESAVSAGLVGAPVVIVVAFTAISSFLIPAQNESSSIIRLYMMVLAAISGLYGIAMGFIAMLLHIGSLTSFGVDYFDGFANKQYLEDSFVRMPLWAMVYRPKGLAYKDSTRRKFFIPPMRPFEKPGNENSQSDNTGGGQNSEQSS